METNIAVEAEFSAGKNNIAWVSSNFKEYFYGMEFVLSTQSAFKYEVLERPMNDTEIIEKYSPEVMSLDAVRTFLQYAEKGGWYIFYVLDKEGIKRAVRAGWNRDGWSIEAYPVSDPDKWSSGDRVVSGKFSGTQAETLSTSDPLTLEDRVLALEEWRERTQHP